MNHPLDTIEKAPPGASSRWMKKAAGEIGRGFAFYGLIMAALVIAGWAVSSWIGLAGDGLASETLFGLLNVISTFAAGLVAMGVAYARQQDISMSAMMTSLARKEASRQIAGFLPLTMVVVVAAFFAMSRPWVNQFTTQTWATNTALASISGVVGAVYIGFAIALRFGRTPTTVWLRALTKGTDKNWVPILSCALYIVLVAAFLKSFGLLGHWWTQPLAIFIAPIFSIWAALIMYYASYEIFPATGLYEKERQAAPQRAENQAQTSA